MSEFIEKSIIQRPSSTKIVATLGPASNNAEMLHKLILAGVDVFRINAAHGSIAEFAQTVKNVRDAEAKVGLPLGILMDLGGPKIRLGMLPGDSLTMVTGSKVRFVRSGSETQASEVPLLTCTYEPLVDELALDDRIMLADGTVTLRVTAKSDATPCEWAECTVVEGGTVRSRQGVNLPGVKLSIPAMLEVDRTNAAWAAQNGVDFLGLSFVWRAEEIEDLRSLIQQNGGTTQIVAKIEKPEAVENLLEIVRATDAVMVARGDLGVETDIAELPILQKEIIRLCHEYRKPVIVATQMLESMTHNNFPTRAEVNDIANAILDGADACMLSGETAVGEFPVEAVQMMHRIALTTEKSVQSDDYSFISDVSTFDPLLEATAHSACELAENTDAKFIFAATETGGTALCLSTNRCPTQILGLSHSVTALRRMALYWGVNPVQLPAELVEPSAVMQHAVRRCRELGFLQPGERVVLLANVGGAKLNNTMMVHEIE